MPSFAELPELGIRSAKSRRCLTIPGFEIQYDKGSFRMFGPLAAIDWEDFDFENVLWHLPFTNDYDDFVYEAQANVGAALSNSDGEPEEQSFYDTLELESDEVGERTDDGSYDEYEMEAFDNADGTDYESGDYVDDATTS